MLPSALLLTIDPENRTVKPEPWIWYLLGLISPLLVIACNLAGGYWVSAGILYMLGIGPLLDLACGRDERPKPPRESGRPLVILLYTYAALQLACILSLLYRAALDGPALTTWLAAFSTGLSSSTAGIIVAHELGHTRPGSLSWWLGRLNLLTVLYLHFTTEHNFTHHKHVATGHDPASATQGESLWWFVARTVPGQLLDAAAVQRRKGRRGLGNPVYRGVLLQFALVLAIYLLLGPWVTLAFLLQSAFAIFLLEYINYIRHYGLRREANERLTEMHSWQAEQRWSRWTLLELTRHPAHHLKASEPFWKLQPYEQAPSLPSGYYGCFWIALIPPLWRRLMDPRIPVPVDRS